ncbi:MAG: iron complex outermembrane recepter protein [Comamonadaceae bacterium]|nr:MAG: iron complex outermembrane recepter protein [Comamonadaceae bacterium]
MQKIFHSVSRSRLHQPCRLSLVALAVMALSAPGVSAQSAAKVTTLDEVVVSASRSEQRSFDAPAAVQAVDRAAIEQGGPQVNLSETLNRVPGLTILNRQNYAQDLQVSIRGFGARSAFGIRGIRLLVDGIPATTPDGQGQGSTISLTSTERLEVLRGPLAQMYGNSAGGVIQAFTRSAPEVPEFEASAYTGSFGLHRTDWQYAGKLGSVGLVADYSTFDVDGYRGNSATERKQFNGKLSFSPAESSQVNVVFNRFDMPLARDPLGLTQAQWLADPAQAGDSAVSRNVRKTVLQNQLGATLETRLDANRSLSARAYTGTRDNLQYQAGIFGVTPTGAWVSLNRTYYGAGLQYKAQSVWGAVPVNWLVGYDYDLSTELRQGGAAALGEKTSTTRNEDNQASNSDLFLQGTALLSEQFSLVGGLRHSRVSMQSDDHDLSNGDGSGSIRFAQTSPVLGLTFHTNEQLNLFATYGQGFESPTLAEMAYKGSGVPAFNTGIKASSSEHYEIGVKWSPSPTSRLDFSAYRINSTDEVVVASSSGGNSTYKNAPGTQRTGWELSGRTQLNDSVRFTLAASQIDAVYSEKFNAGTTAVAAGNNIPGIPQFYVFSELLWSPSRAALAGDTAATGPQVGLELTRAGRLYANDTNTASADGYTTLNVKASYRWKLGRSALTTYARIDNLSDERYVGSVIVNQSGLRFYEPAPGRNWTLGIKLSVPL